jgi:hypothetical protein
MRRVLRLLCRSRRESGQSTVEYAGLLTVVSVLLLAISHVSVGERVVASLGDEVCGAILGSPCSGSADDLHAARLATLEPCPLRSAVSEEAVNATVVSLRGAGADEAVVEQYSDGRVAVTFRDTGELGGEVGVGAGVAVKGVHGARGGGGLRAEAGAGVGMTVGKTYEFAGARRAAAFLARYGGAETLGGEAVGRAVAACPACRELGAHSAALPAPDATFLEGGANVRARAAAGAGPAAAGVDALAEAATGRRVDRRTGQETLYWRIAGDASVDLAALLGVGQAKAAIAGGRDTTLALRRAADGTPLELTVESTRRYSHALEGSLGLPAAARGGPDAGAGSISADVADGGVLHHEAVLDLRSDVLSRAAAVRLVRALGRVTDPAELLDSARAVSDRIAAVGELSVRTFDSRRGAAGLQAAGAVGVKLGAGFQSVAQARTLTAAYTRPAGATAFVDRTDCIATAP